MYRCILPLLLLFLLCACSSQRNISSSSPERSRISRQLGFPITKKDDLKLYAEAVRWLGVPYLYGGNTRKGVDCSGLTCNLYRNVYAVSLERTVAGMHRKNCRKINQNRLRPGDLVFFNTTEQRRKITHVGVYLKDRIFIHATTRRGVCLNSLDDTYYKKRWMGGGKVKH